MSLEDYIESLPVTQLPSVLESEGVKVIEVPASSFGTRKAFINVKPEHVDFKQGQRVLPAEFVGTPEQEPVYYNKTYPPGTKCYSDGGHQCITGLGGYRTFFLDALIIHPSEMGRSKKFEVEGLRKRGRKANPDKLKAEREKDPNAPKGKRGRKPLDPEEKARREAEKAAKLTANPERKRGRPPMDPSLKKQITIKDPNAPKGKRGRKPLDPEEKARREALKVEKLAVNPERKRGRPKKQV